MDKVYRAISDPTRRTILRLLRDCDLTAGEIAGHFDLAKPTLSKHFSVLREAGLVSDRKSGRHVTYQLNADLLESALVSLMEDYHFIWTPPIDVESAAKELVESLVRRDFSGVIEKLDDEAAAILTPEKLQEHWELVVGHYGPFVKQIGVKIGKGMKYTSVTVACEFGRSPLGIKVVYARSGRISGLWFTEGK